MSRTGPVGVGFIGTGMISNTYLENLTRFPDIDVIILGDLNADLAEARAEQHGVRQWGTADDVLHHPDVEVVVNLTIPAVHAEVAVEGDRRRQARVDREAHQRRPGRAAATCSPRPRRRACWSGSLPTPSSARACRPPAGPSPAATSASPCRRRPSIQYIGPGHLPPEPGVPVRPRCRPAVRHRPLLPDRPRAVVRVGPQRRRGRLDRAAPPVPSRPAIGPGTVFDVQVPDPRVGDRAASSTAASARACSASTPR